MYINIIICVLGILVNTLGCTFNLFILNIAGALLCTAAAFRFRCPGLFQKKVRIYSALSVPFSTIAYAITLVKVDNMDILYSVSLGINTFFFIYFTYYFTEMLINHAKGINELAATRNLLSVWILNGIVSFLFFMAYTSSFKPAVMNIARIIILVVTLYYAFSVHSAARILFPKEK